jgi:transporter family-2 protein
MRTFYVILALVGGAGVVVQVGLNSALRRYAGQPVWATLVSFMVGTGAISVAFVATRQAWPTRAQFAGAPWWIWVGGLLGAAYVFSSVIAGPRLGAAAYLACVIVGQLLASILIDHYGWVGFPVHTASPGRILGAVLLLGGVALVLRY